MFFQRLEELCTKKGTNPTAVCKLITKSTGNLATWKNGNARNDHLAKLAKYFNVSTDYLLGISDNPTPLIHPANEYIADGIIRMNVIGTISAGYDGQAVEEIIDTTNILSVNLGGYQPDECFLLKVHGNSMYPDFHDGDLIAVHRQTSVDSGDIAVVMYGGDNATLKRVEYKTGEDWMRLIPRNPEYEEKLIKGTDLEQCLVLGKVLSIVHRAI